MPLAILPSARSFPAINRPRGASLSHDNFRKQWQLGLQLFPNPHGDDFARRIFQTGYLVQIIMVELFPDRLERGRDVGVIHQPAQFGIALAGHDNFHAETVAVQATALVIIWQMRQQMRRLKLKRLS